MAVVVGEPTAAAAGAEEEDIILPHAPNQCSRTLGIKYTISNNSKIEVNKIMSTVQLRDIMSCVLGHLGQMEDYWLIRICRNCCACCIATNKWVYSKRSNV
jgi:hypothetical protein